MKKSIRGLIAGAAVLVVLGGAYAALNLMDKEDNSSSASSSADSSSDKTLYSYDTDSIKSIKVSNEYGEYSAVPMENKNEDSAGEQTSFTIEGFENLDVNYTMTSSLANNCKELKAQVVDENPEDLEKFGLKEPLATVTVDFDGKTEELYVGNQSPVSDKTYVMIKGDNTVYTSATSNLSIFTSESTYYISTGILEESTDEDGPKAEEITISRKELGYDIKLVYDKNSESEGDGNTNGTLATYYMSDPIFAYLDVEKSVDATHGLYGLTANSVMTANPSEKELKAAGLDDPQCIITMKSDNSKNYKLSLGTDFKIDGETYYFAYFEGKDVIYSIPESSLCWATLKPDDIMSRMVFGTFVWDIESLTIEADNKKTVFNGEGTSADDYKVTKNGKECETERFRQFYTFILKTAAEEFSMDEKPSGEPIAAVEIKTQEGKTQNVEFYKAEGKKSLIVVDGVPSFKCRASYVDLLLKNLDKFDGTEDFEMIW